MSSYFLRVLGDSLFPNPSVEPYILTPDGGRTIPTPRAQKQSKSPLRPPSRPRRRRFSIQPAFAILFASAVIAIAPLLVYGPSRGGDFGFHLTSWIDAKQAISTGNLYPHWAYSPNFGAGEPRFLFYPPIAWMAGAILGFFLPWNAVSILLFVLLLAATGCTTRALARETMPDGPATLAGCAAIFLTYALFNVYKRCDFSELAGAALIPLLLLFSLRRRDPSGSFWQSTLDGSAAPLALIIAAIWLSNGPVGIMGTYLLAGVALVSARLEKSLVPIARAAISTFAGMALAGLYLIPAIAEKKWASFQLAITGKYFSVENNWIFGFHADPDMLAHDMLLLRVSVVAVVMLTIAVVGAVIATLRHTVPGPRRWWLPLALIPPAVLFLLVPISLPVWNHLPELRLLQFPWRWLVVLEAPMAIAFAAAAWPTRRALRIPVLAACAALFLGSSYYAFHSWFLETYSFQSNVLESVREGAGVLGKPEYAPPGIQYPQLDLVLHGDCLLNAPLTPTAPAWDGSPATCDGSAWHQPVLLTDFSHSGAASYMQEQHRLVGFAPHPGYLILRLRYFPAWAATVNGAPVTPLAERLRGLMAIPVPQGNVQVAVDWTTTPDVVAGRTVTFAALLLLAALYSFERKRLPPLPATASPQPATPEPPAPARKPKPSRRK